MHDLKITINSWPSSPREKVLQQNLFFDVAGVCVARGKECVGMPNSLSITVTLVSTSTASGLGIV